MRRHLLVTLSLIAVGCARSHSDGALPPALASSSAEQAGSNTVKTAPSPPPSSVPPTPGKESSAEAAPSGAAPGPALEAASAAQPALLDADGKPLPQTDERPRADDPAFLARLELLVRAIERDEPELARPAFFPVVAYQQVKAIEKPERDHEARLMKAFARDVHEYHRALGSAADGVRFSGIQLPESKVRFMKPGAEGNRLGYFRVVRPTLEVVTRDGTKRPFEITSLISWRGGWYVVHLHGFG